MIIQCNIRNGITQVHRDGILYEFKDRGHKKEDGTTAYTCPVNDTKHIRNFIGMTKAYVEFSPALVVEEKKDRTGFIDLEEILVRKEEEEQKQGEPVAEPEAKEPEPEVTITPEAVAEPPKKNKGGRPRKVRYDAT